MSAAARRPVRVVVTGSECTGKTTLAADLAAHFDAACSSEVSRARAERKAGALTAADVEPIALAQMRAEDDAEAAARHGLVVLDTDLVSTVVYARHYYGACPAWIESAALARRGDLYLLLHPDVPWLPDGVRDRPQARDELHALFARALRAFGARVADVRGDWSTRRATAIAAIDALLAESPHNTAGRINQSVTGPPLGRQRRGRAPRTRRQRDKSGGSALTRRVSRERTSAGEPAPLRRGNVGPMIAGPPPALDRRPEARAEAVEDLVRLAARGHVRVPGFQRGLKWRAREVVDLFDSVYRGYPIGSLLLFKRAAPAARVHLGPLSVDAPEVPDAWWVVDGQQRLTALTASMARPEPLPAVPEDPFVVFFDPAERAFRAPAKGEAIPDRWVPVTVLLDAARLSEWIFKWPHARDHRIRSAVFEAGKRLREYRVPMYILDSDDPDLLKEIFFRVNKYGKALQWNEVYDALYGHHASSPGTIAQLSRELAGIGMGSLAPRELTFCLLAIRGLDVTRTVADHHRKDPNVLRGAVADALPVLRRVQHFLRAHAAVPHLRVLPRTFVIEVLARFFMLHPNPGPRTLSLLTRWAWRVFLSGSQYEERTLRRRAVAAVNPDDEEGSVQQLLDLVARERVAPTLPRTFDARAARSRLALLALASLEPRGVTDGGRLDVAELIETRGADAFRHVFPVGPKSSRVLRGPANRVLLPGTGSARVVLLQRVRSAGEKDEILASHAISPAAARCLEAGAGDDFVRTRATTVTETLVRLGDRLAGWTRQDRDRPSIRYLLTQPEQDT